MSSPHCQIRRKIISRDAKIVGKNNILLVGDSITEGFSWNKLGTKPCINAGISGADVSCILGVVEEFLTESSPAITTLLIGVNDAKIEFQNPIEVWASTFKRIAEKIINLSPTLLLMTILPIDIKNPSATSFANPDLIIEYNNYIRYYSRKNNIPMVDTYKLFSDENILSILLAEDGVHLSEHGYGILLSILQQAVQRLDSTIL